MAIFFLYVVGVSRLVRNVSGVLHTAEAVVQDRRSGRHVVHHDHLVRHLPCRLLQALDALQSLARQLESRRDEEDTTQQQQV